MHLLFGVLSKSMVQCLDAVKVASSNGQIQSVSGSVPCLFKQFLIIPNFIIPFSVITLWRNTKKILDLHLLTVSVQIKT